MLWTYASCSRTAEPWPERGAGVWAGPCAACGCRGASCAGKGACRPLPEPPAASALPAMGLAGASPLPEDASSAPEPVPETAPEPVPAPGAVPAARGVFALPASLGMSPVPAAVSAVCRAGSSLAGCPGCSLWKGLGREVPGREDSGAGSAASWRGSTLYSVRRRGESRHDLYER